MLETPRFGLRSLLSLRHDEDGAAMAEYGLLITLIAAVVAGVASLSAPTSWLSTLPSPAMSRGFPPLSDKTGRLIMQRIFH